MAVDLSVYGNHQLRFKTAKEGISKLKEVFTNRAEELLVNMEAKETQELDKVKFFVNDSITNSHYDIHKKILIRTNFAFCDTIYLMDKVIKFNPKGFYNKFSKWKEYLIKGYLKYEVELKKMQQYSDNWEKFRQFAHYTTKLLNGNRIVYLDDHSYQIEEETLYNGGTLEEFYQQLCKYQEPFELEALELFPDEPLVKDNTWYYEKVV